MCLIVKQSQTIKSQYKQKTGNNAGPEKVSATNWSLTAEFQFSSCEFCDEWNF